MRIAVLSRNARLYSTSRLVAAAEKRGHTVEVIDPIACVLVISRSSHALLHKGERLPDYDVVLPRIGASITDYGLAVLAHFERDGVPLMNSATAIARSRDKLRALQLLSLHDVGIPRTAMAREPSAIRGAIDAVGGTPVIIKLVQGTQGVGVMIADSAEGAESIFDTLWGLGQNIILQEFISESRGRDVRALVVGGEVVAAMRRTARAGEFRSNLHRGGAGVALDLSPDYRAAATAAAGIIGLEAAGVDLLESDQGPRVVEVNSSPGLRGIEHATGVDVADRIIARAETIAREKSERRARTVGTTLGWCEWVGLPDLGVARLKAKIDTGARSCALHVLSSRPTGDGAIEIEIPSESGVVRALCRAVGTTTVRDSGGHAVRRPLIETALALGGDLRRVRVTLADRGDMLFPMLIGRTALAGTIVDPASAFLLGR